MSGRKRVLVCPLDWGLGHATRCIPLIHALLSEDAEVIVAADGNPLALLMEEFPELQFVRLLGYRIHYSKRSLMSTSMILQSPKILFNIFLEHKRLIKIISDYKIDRVISDNRYGLWNKNIRTVFITHQLSIKCPQYLKFLEPLLYGINYFFIKKFNQYWVPDAEGENNLSGSLSHRFPLPGNGTFIGLLSRFDTPVEIVAQKKYDVMAIISGPEPHRSLLLEMMTSQLTGLSISALIVSGEPENIYDRMVSGNVRMVSHLNKNEMKEAIMQSEVIICRAGYSGIMDMVTLKKKTILIPTPGQTEQEYLANYMKQRGLFYSMTQQEFNIECALKEISGYGDFSKTGFEKNYSTAIKLLMGKINK